MGSEREARGGAAGNPPAVAGNPAAAADAEQHARQEIADLQGRLQRRARHMVRWLAVATGAVSGRLVRRKG